MTSINQKYVEVHNGKFRLLMEPLKKYWYFSKSRHENISLSGFTAVLERSFTPFLMNTYLPTTLLTVVSFIGFLIPVDMVPGRMALLVTIFLTLVNIRSIEQKTGPVVRKSPYHEFSFVHLNIFRQGKLQLWTFGYYYACYLLPWRHSSMRY